MPNPPSLRLARAWVTAAVFAITAAASSAQVPAGIVPDFRVEVRGFSDEFQKLMWQYANLRRGLEEGLPPLALTAHPAEMWTAERALARRIRHARGPAEGALFTPPISAEFKNVLLESMTVDMRATVHADNPGEFPHSINGNYPRRRAVSAMPPTLLARLPALPPDVQYRFLGRHLILHDTRANVILDRIVCALGCERGR